MPIAENENKQKEKTSFLKRLFHSNLDFDYPNKARNDHGHFMAPYSKAKREK